MKTNNFQKINNQPIALEGICTDSTKLKNETTTTNCTTANAGKTATAGTATGGSSTSNGTTKNTGTSSSWETNFHKFETTMDLWFIWFDRKMTKLSKLLGQLFRALLIAFVLAYFVPELRDKLPNFYLFVDTSLDIFNYIWGLIIWLIKELVHINL